MEVLQRVIVNQSSFRVLEHVGVWGQVFLGLSALVRASSGVDGWGLAAANPSAGYCACVAARQSRGSLGAYARPLPGSLVAAWHPSSFETTAWFLSE